MYRQIMYISILSWNFNKRQREKLSQLLLLFIILQNCSQFHNSVVKKHYLVYFHPANYLILIDESRRLQCLLVLGVSNIIAKNLKIIENYVLYILLTQCLLEFLVPSSQVFEELKIHRYVLDNSRFSIRFGAG